MLLLVALAAGAWFFFLKKAPADAPGARVAFDGVPAGLAEKFSGANALAQVQALTNLGPRPPASPGYEKALAYAEAEFAKAGWTTRRQAFTRATPKGPVNFTNLMARMDTDWTASVPVVIGGHLDSKDLQAFPFVGANDGGSSTGVILELARVLSSDKGAAGKVEFVLFDGEEAFLTSLTNSDGLYGSKYYAQEMSKRSTWPSVGIVLDLVGDKDYDTQYNPDAPGNFRTAVEAAAKDSGLTLKTYAGQILDDHQPLQHTGLPVLHVIGDFTRMPYWHQAGDTMDVIDAEALEKTGRTVLRFLAGVK